MKLKPIKAKIPAKHPWEVLPAEIISDPTIATVGVADGRFIPLLIIDSSDRPDIEELVRVHEHLPPGDVTVQWVQLLKIPNSIALLLRFIRPVEALLIINFDIAKQGGIVDQILSSRALYIQPGRKGDRLINTLDAKKVLIDIPETGFSKTWDDIFFTHMVKWFRQKGLKKYEAKEAAKKAIKEWRRLGQLRPWGFTKMVPGNMKSAGGADPIP